MQCDSAVTFVDNTVFFQEFIHTKAIPYPERPPDVLTTRLKKTIRLYGVSPKVIRSFGKRGRVNDLPVAKKPDPESITIKEGKKKDDGKPRVNGPQIAPSYGEENEFELFEFNDNKQEPV